MSFPTTPSKKGEELNQLLFSLNSRWNLNLPVRHDPISPSKVPNKEGRGEKIFHCIRFLFYRNPDALHVAIAGFEKHAYQRQQQQQQSARIDKNSGWLKSNNLSDVDTEALKDALLHFLNTAGEKPQRAKPIEEVISSSKGAASLSSHAANHRPMPHEVCSSPSVLTSHEGTGSTSSCGFNPTQDTNGIMLDLVIRSSQTVSDLTPLSDDSDIFTTPPTSPLRGHAQEAQAAQDEFERTQPNSEAEDDDEYIVHERDRVTLPQELNLFGKKRPLPDAEPISRKMTREDQGRRAILSYGFSDVRPQEVDLSQSSGSISRATSFTTGSTARTTPNTSFCTVSALTSIGTSSNDLTSNQLMREQATHNRDVFWTPPADGIKRMVEQYRVTRTVNEPPTETVASDFPIASRLSSTKYDDLFLHSNNPFAPLTTMIDSSLSFRQLYEVSRIALHYGLPISTLSASMTNEISDYDLLWSNLHSNANSGEVAPEKSSIQAWDAASKDSPCVAFTGDLKYNDQAGKPIFHFEMKPLKVDRSSRLLRKVGGDRVFVLGIPGFTLDELPASMKRDAENKRHALMAWLFGSDHQFLGRTWRAVVSKPVQPSTKLRKAGVRALNTIKYRVFLFATNGEGFEKHEDLDLDFYDYRKGHIMLTIEKLVHWLIAPRWNPGQLCLKLYTRILLAVSSTIPTVVFSPGEIIRASDAYAASAGVRRLSLNRHSNETGGRNESHGSAVMNDGCARISRSAAAAVANILGLSGQIPSVFQARIGGAKGIWMVDVLGETLEASNRDYWIEITDSQLKFEQRPPGVLEEDPAKLTFEVLTVSAPLKASALNFQLMPILAEGGVPSRVFERLLKEDLTTKESELDAAMSSGLALRKWSQETTSVAASRMRNCAVEMLAGLPSSSAEKINWFVEHGFEPASCEMLRDLCHDSIKSYCDRLEDRLHIGIGRSTFALMIADPLGILAEGEVHLGFSSAFRDEKSGFSDTILNDMEVLVARCPSHLPSDIQKVRAVFKPELNIYKDVIVFSSRGTCSLAEKLSGGDYDGDQAWICWDPNIVTSFKNAQTYCTPELDFYGIIKDTTKVSDIIDKPDYVSEFLRKGFEFNIQPQMLGVCSVYHESLCYSLASINHKAAKDIGSLLGLLVDSAKGGFIFTNDAWTQFRQKMGLPMRLPKPAYKDKNAPPRLPKRNLIDNLVFNVAKGTTAKALTQFTKRFEGASRWDHDLNAVYKAEDEVSRRDPILKSVLGNLRAELEGLFTFWTKHAYGEQLHDGHVPHRGETTFKARIEQLRDRFLALEPAAAQTTDPKPPLNHITDRWAKDDGSVKGAWLRLKASMLWNKYHTRGKFIWYVAGKELGELKLLGRGKARGVGEDLFWAYKLDSKMVRRAKDRDAEAQALPGIVVGGEDVEEWGVEWEFPVGDE